MKPISEFGWNGCWKCEHCIAVCPTGAVSILGHRPEDSVKPPRVSESAAMMRALILNRRSCRRFKEQDVDSAVINDMLACLANAPNGGNKQQVEFTLLDRAEQTRRFRRLAYTETERLASKGIYPQGFDKTSYEQMKNWEKTARPDMLLCGAPHLLIPHAPLGSGTPVQDVIIAAAYFELLCASHGLGAVFMTFPLDSLKNMPEIAAKLEIPESHYIGAIVGFGYPEIQYRRGTQRLLDPSRIHRPFDKENTQ